MTDRSSKTAPQPFGRYLLEGRIAVGGMSEVFLARPAQGATPAAQLVIKRLLPDIVDDPHARATFATEARLQSAARHPNVVQIFETGEHAGEPYLAMEYVPGVDAFRIMRRSQVEQRPIRPAVAVYVARELCKALAFVHSLCDETGSHLAVVHRDVTPSNIYLSETGDVKLGDFGIARSDTHEAAFRRDASAAPKGKYAYLAPEQVGGEPSDHRADLFSLAVVLGEMLIGEHVFPGAGQLAVLLAIRDARIDTLRARFGDLPEGLGAVLDKALARSPDDRYASAADLYDALEPFEQPSRAEAKNELAGWVAYARDSVSLARQLESTLFAGKKPVVVTAPPPDGSESEMPPSGRPTVAPDQPMVASVRRKFYPGTSSVPPSSRVMSDVPFSKLVELIATGQLARDDEVDVGQGFQPIEAITPLARYLPPSTATTARLEGPGVPDYAAELPAMSMLEVLAWLLTRLESGVLFAERGTGGDAGATAEREARTTAPAVGQGGLRKELYVERGKLVLVASSEPSELFGEYLVRRGSIDRAELEMALLVMHRYDGRLGDTLIGLGLVDAVEVFQAIRAQGRDRVAGLFAWPAGRVSFYRSVKAQRVEFPLDIDLPSLMLAGMALAEPSSDLVERWQPELGGSFGVVTPAPSHAGAVTWPAPVVAMLRAFGPGRRLSEALAVAGRGVAEADMLRGLEVALACGLVVRR